MVKSVVSWSRVWGRRWRSWTSRSTTAISTGSRSPSCPYNIHTHIYWLELQGATIVPFILGSPPLLGRASTKTRHFRGPPTQGDKNCSPFFMNISLEPVLRHGWQYRKNGGNKNGFSEHAEYFLHFVRNKFFSGKGLDKSPKKSSFFYALPYLRYTDETTDGRTEFIYLYKVYSIYMVYGI